MMLPTDRMRILRRALSTIKQQNTEIERLQTAITEGELAYMRIGRDLIEQFLIALDTPENHEVIHDRLVVALGFYRDEIAVREEQVG